MMKILEAALALGFGLLAGLSFAAGETLNRTIRHDGKERSFRLTVPKFSDERALPLVIGLHYYPGSGRGFETLTGFSDLAEREGFLVAYPDGLNDAFNALMCCGSEDDVGFIRAVIAEVAREHKVDRDRIYATGISNGGDMTYRLAAELPGVFAAVAPVSGGMTQDWMGKPSGNLPAKPVSLISFIGKRDRYAEMFIAGTEFWRDKLKCGITVAAIENDAAQLRKGTCADGSSVQIYVLPDMGHAWPGGTGASSLAYPAAPFKATEIIWNFFRDNPRK
ncbi:MAG: PHB depolymerase family esterase [Parvibaculaceae bacterium]